LKLVAQVAALAACYFAAGRVGLYLHCEFGNVTLIWAPTGLTLAAMLLFGGRVWPGAWIGAFLVNHTIGSPLVASATIACGNTLEGLAGLYLLRRYGGFDHRMQRLRDVIALGGLGGCISTLVSALVGATTLCLFCGKSWAAFGSIALYWWLGDGMGNLLIAPLVLTMATCPKPRLTTGRLIEAVVLYGGVILVGLIVFFRPGYLIGSDAPCLYCIFPLLIWSAIRFGACGAAVTSFMVAVVSTAATFLHHGPFTLPERVGQAGLMGLMAYLAIVANTGLILAATLAERHRAEESCRTGEERYRTLLENCPEGILVNRDGFLAYANPAAARIFGASRPEELIGRPALDCVHPDYHDVVRQRIHHLLSTGRVVPLLEEKWVRLDGTSIDVEVTATAIEQNGDRAILVIVRDITDRRRAQKLAQDRQAEMEELVSIIAHDIRHPLVSIQGLLSLIQEGCADTMDQEQLENLRLGLAECDRLKRMVGDLSRVARIEREPIERQRVGLPDFIHAILARFRKQIEERDISVAIDSPEVQAEIATAQVEEALSNLIENAVLYGCAGDRSIVEIRAQAGRNRITIEVGDRGRGIAPADQAKVFQLFCRLNPHGPVAGSGVGLTAVRRLMNRIGGDVRLDSSPGEGTRVSLTFPAEVVRARSGQPVKPHAQSWSS
jgi:PAS domain S-box-containing protein